MVEAGLCPPMAEQERLDLEQEAGRPLTDEQAHAFRIRRLQGQALAHVLESSRTRGRL